MPVQKLTKRLVDALRPLPDADVMVWDSELKGFGVRVKPTGAKAYVIQYRTRQRVGRRLTLGSTSLLTVEEARRKAAKHLVEVRDGADPAQQRHDDRAARTLDQVWDAFVDGYLDPAQRKVKPITRESYVVLYDRHVRGRFGKRPIDAITEEDLRKFHAGLSGTPYSANRTLAALSSCWSYTFGKRHNPCIGLRRFKEEEVQRRLSPGELRALGEAMRAFARLPTRHPSLAPFFLLTALTGTRKGEWLIARWRMVDWESGLLWLEDSKTGGKPVEIPALALQVLEVVRERARSVGAFEPDAFVLPGRLAGKPLVNPYKAWDVIRQQAGTPNLRIHDLRHLFGTVSHRSGASQKTVAMLLGHSQLKTTERYIHGYDEDRKAAAELTAGQLSKAMRLVTSARTGASAAKRLLDAGQSPARASARPSERPRQQKKQAR